MAYHEDEKVAESEDQHMEDDENDNVDEIWVRIMLSLRISMWRMMKMMWMRYCRDEDKDKAVPEDQHMEDEKKHSEDKMWVRMRIRMRFALRISIWRMTRKMMRMTCG